MGAAAVAAAKAVGYVGAGTVEFIVEQSERGMDFFFMEMNTRLQVEHPVTEAITGLDLVEWQLRVACGEPLPLKQSALRIHGHAIEARLCAENPDNQFLPATGRLNVYRKPEATSFEPGQVRIDDGVREGDAISPYYDSMVAKLIVHGDTREQALARLDTALAQTHIVGLATNVQFLRHVLRSPSFAQAQLDTALIEREKDVLFHQKPVSRELSMAAVVAHTLATEQALVQPDATGWVDPLAQRDGWQSHGHQRRQWLLDDAGESLTVTLTYGASGALTLSTGEDVGSAFQWQQVGERLLIQWGAQRCLVAVYLQGETAHVFTPQGAARMDVVDALAHAGEAPHETGRLTAPMPGKMVSFAVKVGDAVKAGQALAVMEAMKMEHTIQAPSDGKVAELLFAPGDQVTEGAELLRLEA
jgi:3-methylcrotonyl-CoA carboxylase alpha subunit